MIHCIVCCNFEEEAPETGYVIPGFCSRCASLASPSPTTEEWREHIKVTVTADIKRQMTGIKKPHVYHC